MLRYGSDWSYAHVSTESFPDPNTPYPTQQTYANPHYYSEPEYVKQGYQHPHQSQYPFPQSPYPTTHYSYPLLQTTYSTYPTHSGEEYVEAYLVPRVPYSSDNYFRQYRQTFSS